MNVVDELFRRVFEEMDSRIIAALRRHRFNISGVNVEGTLPAENGGTGNGTGSTKPRGPAGGDLDGDYPNPRVVGLQSRPVANVAPGEGQVLAWSSLAQAWRPTNPTGTGGGGGGSPSGQASGDLRGEYPGPIVKGFQARPFTDAAPQDGMSIVWNGTTNTWEPAFAEVQPTGGGGDGSQPIGPAGGDLQGLYPNPTVRGIQGRPVAPTAPQLNQVLRWDGTQYIPATIYPGSGGGDGSLPQAPGPGYLLISTDLGYVWGSIVTDVDGIMQDDNGDIIYDY